MGKVSRIGNDLYSGKRSINFVGRAWLWYFISGVVIVVSLVGLTTKGLNLGIEFKGGTEYTVSLPTSQVTQDNADKLRGVVADAGVPAAAAPTVNTNGDKSILVTVEQMSQDDSDKVITAIADAMNINPSDVNQNGVGASWGAQVLNKALTGLIVFLVLVMLLIWAYFREWKMSIGAVVSVLHDLLITVGIYSLSGFQVTPATITGLLTILGFSLYDTVVVFDKIRENTKNVRQSRQTYAQLANLAINQTLVRSINTSFVALLPVLALLIVSVVTLGTGDLQDLSLALFVGMAAGAYSSIFIASPLAVQLKSAEHAVSEQDRRAKARQRRDADRYANVPSFTEDMGVDRASLTGGVPDELAEDGEPGEPGEEIVIRTAPPRRDEAAGSGRVVPESKAPLRESGSAKRSQPKREPRSKRGK